MRTLTLFKNTWRHIGKNLWYYIQVSILIYLILAYLAKGILSYTFNRIIGVAGIGGLGYEDIPLLIRHPMALAFLLLYLMLLAATILGECYLWLICIGQRLGIEDLSTHLKALPKKIKHLFSPQILVVMAYLILMIPLGNLGLTSTLLESLKIPDFIGEELGKSLLGRLSYWGVLMAVGYLNLRLLFFLPLSITTQYSPLQAIKKSWALSRRHLRSLLVLLVSYALASLLILALVSSIASLLFSAPDPKGQNLLLQTSFLSLIKGVGFLLNNLIKLGIFSTLLELIALEAPQQAKPSKTSSKGRHPRLALVSQITCFLVLVSWLGINALALFNLQPVKTPLMIAHRGDTKVAAENSIAAMQAAHKAGADYSEMDVVMTKDKQFIVTHDKTLKRLAGLDKPISDMSLKEVTAIPIRQNGQTSHIASLSQFMAAAKQSKQKILIELKPYDNDIDTYLQHFIHQVEQEQLLKGNQFMSTNRELAEKLNQRLPQAQVGYIIPLQFGAIPDYRVDFYAIEDFSVNDLTLMSAAKQKKPVYVWTINKTNQLQYYLDSPVQGIITDELSEFKQQEASYQKNDTYVDRATRLLTGS